MLLPNGSKVSPQDDFQGDQNIHIKLLEQVVFLQAVRANQIHKWRQGLISCGYIVWRKNIVGVLSAILVKEC